jgi:uncharacterized protein
MIIEGIITTEDVDGGMHVSPIGPHVDDELSEWTLKPFQSSTTFSNLHRTGRGVFHVIDDALLMARAVLGLCGNMQSKDSGPASELAAFDPQIGWILANCCRYFALGISEWDISAPRAVARCVITAKHDVRPFWGWNRAVHSILELSILASRVHMLEPTYIQQELERHKTIIDKTAGPREIQAWELLVNHLSQ